MNVELISSLARIRCEDLLRQAAVRRLLVRADRRRRAPHLRFVRAFRSMQHLAMVLTSAFAGSR